MFLKRCATVNIPQGTPPVVQNEMIQVQMERGRCQNHSFVNGSPKHASLPSQTAFTTLASSARQGRITESLLRSFPAT
jgi:hypothetical protein